MLRSYTFVIISNKLKLFILNQINLLIKIDETFTHSLVLLCLNEVLNQIKLNLFISLFYFLMKMFITLPFFPAINIKFRTFKK